MNFISTPLNKLFVIQPQVFGDNRGYFYESYRHDLFAQNNIDVNFVQANRSHSTGGHVIRGLHLQLPPFCQDKLIWVTKGAVFDVAIDGRPQSPTFGKWYGLELSAENHQMLFVPKGFFHGFATLTPEVDFEYLVSNYYHQASEMGLIWNDPEINIHWPVTNPTLSPKDQLLPLFQDIKSKLPINYEADK